MANTVLVLLVLPVTSCSPQRVLPLVCLSKDSLATCLFV